MAVEKVGSLMHLSLTINVNVHELQQYLSGAPIPQPVVAACRAMLDERA